MILPVRILMFLLMLAIAYFIFRWNKNNSGKKRWYALAIIFALASFGALGDTPEARHQEAVESSKVLQLKNLNVRKVFQLKKMQNLQVYQRKKLVLSKLSNHLLNHLKVALRKFQENIFLL